MHRIIESQSESFKDFFIHTAQHHFLIIPLLTKR